MKPPLVHCMLGPHRLDSLDLRQSMVVFRKFKFRCWPKADMRCCTVYVCFWPKADIGFYTAYVCF